MEEEQANAVADALGGDAWNSGGDMWLVVLRRADGKIVAISGDSVCEYVSEDAFEDANATSMIVLH